MPSKPRHGRDYRMRTPHNADLIQVPSATNGYVTITDVNQTAVNQLVLDFDAPILSSVDPSGFFITTNTDVAILIANFPAWRLAASSATIQTIGIAPGTGRVTLDWNEGDLPGGVIDPAANFLAITAQTGDGISFPGRRLTQPSGFAPSIIQPA
jgi:hypothetical protein